MVAGYCSEAGRKRLAGHAARLDLKSLDRIAGVDPNTVRAAVYAKQILQASGLREPLQLKLAPIENVRAAVDRGTVDAAIVYRSDARMAKHTTGGLWTHFGNIT